jgi:hypothetical protein
MKPEAKYPISYGGAPELCSMEERWCRSGQVPLATAPFWEQEEALIKEPIFCDVQVGRTGAELIREYHQNAIRIIKITALFCLARGLKFQLRGSELDSILLMDNSALAGIRNRLRAEPIELLDHRSLAEHHRYSFIPLVRPERDLLRNSYPGQGGIDFKIDTDDPDVLRGLYELLAASSHVAQARKADVCFPNIYPYLPPDSTELDQLNPKVQTSLSMSRVPECPEVESINFQLTIDRPGVIDTTPNDGIRTYKLVTQKFTVASVNISLEHDRAGCERRAANRCSNVDALRGEVVAHDKTESQLIATRVGNIVAFDPDDIELWINLPEIPYQTSFSPEAFAFYEREIPAGNPQAIAAFVEVVIRAIRKSMSFGVELDKKTRERIKSLMKTVTAHWFQVEHNLVYIHKNSTELDVLTEFDAAKTLYYLYETGLFRLVEGLDDELWFISNFPTILRYYHEIVGWFRNNNAGNNIPHWVALVTAIEQAKNPEGDFILNCCTDLRLSRKQQAGPYYDRYLTPTSV